MTEFTTVRKVRFGASARTAEGERGSVTEVVVDQTTGAALAVGIRFGMFARPIYTGFMSLDAGTENEITLDVPRSTLATTPPAGVRLNDATQVTLDGKRVGKLGHITFEYPTGAPLRIVFNRSAGGSVVAPGIALSGVSAGTVALSSERAGVSLALGAYRPDGAVREDVRAAIEQYARMRVDIAGVDIQVVDGVLWLRGYVSSDVNRRLVEDLSSGVAGVVETHNLLVSDPDLAASISSALSRDPATAEERIGVYPSLGKVHLRGIVKTADSRSAAARIAASGHGAREVINELRVDPNASMLPVLAGVTGNEDAVPGGS